MTFLEAAIGGVDRQRLKMTSSALCISRTFSSWRTNTVNASDISITQLFILLTIQRMKEVDYPLGIT